MAECFQRDENNLTENSCSINRTGVGDDGCDFDGDNGGGGIKNRKNDDDEEDDDFKMVRLSSKRKKVVKSHSFSGNDCTLQVRVVLWIQWLWW